MNKKTANWKPYIQRRCLSDSHCKINYYSQNHKKATFTYTYTHTHKHKHTHLSNVHIRSAVQTLSLRNTLRLKTCGINPKSFPLTPNELQISNKPIVVKRVQIKRCLKTKHFHQLDHLATNLHLEALVVR